MKNRILSTVLAFAMVLAMIPSAFAESVSEPDKAAQINGEQYDTLTQAIEAAEDGDTITLLKDVTGFTNEELTGNKNIPVFLINKDITLDGNGHKLVAGTFTTTRNPIIGVENDGEGSGAKVTIRDLTIVGNADTGHGINVWSQATGEGRPTLTLEQVTIQNCGTAAIVVNNAVVTAADLTTSGNAWGAINVDDAESMFTLTSGELNEASQIWTEAQPSGSEPENIQVPESWQYVVMNKDNGEGQSDVKYHLTTDPIKLGEAHNETTNTVYDKAARALEGAENGQTVSLIRSARLLEGATVKEGVRLVVRENVTLTGDLTNNGTVENNGAIAGTVEGSGSVEGSGELLAVITFEVTPEEAVVTVYDSSSDKVEAAYDKSYNLADGSQLTREYTLQLYTTDLADPNSVASLLNNIINAPDAIEGSYFSGVESQDAFDSLAEASVENVYNAGSQTYDSLEVLSEADRNALLAAVRSDMAAGRLGQRYLFDDKERNDTCYLADLKLSFFKTIKETDQYGEVWEHDWSTTVTIGLQITATDTIACLEELGLIDENHQLTTHTEDMLRYSGEPGAADTVREDGPYTEEVVDGPRAEVIPAD